MRVKTHSHGVWLFHYPVKQLSHLLLDHCLQLLSLLSAKLVRLDKGFDNDGGVLALIDHEVLLSAAPQVHFEEQHRRHIRVCRSLLIPFGYSLAWIGLSSKWLLMLFGCLNPLLSDGVEPGADVLSQNGSQVLVVFDLRSEGALSLLLFELDLYHWLIALSLLKLLEALRIELIEDELALIKRILRLV